MTKHTTGTRAGHSRNGGRTPRKAQAQSNRASWRGDKRTAAQRGYGYRWQQAAKLYLDRNPLCVMCQAKGIVCAATVVDHITPHKGDVHLFWAVDNWQALCKPCHDTDKKAIENHGHTKEIGLDGWPVDDRHPVNAHSKNTIISKTYTKRE